MGAGMKAQFGTGKLAQRKFAKNIGVAAGVAGVSILAFSFGAMLVAQTRPTQSAEARAAKAPANAASKGIAAANDVSKTPQATQYRAMLDKYCVGCHDESSQLPSEDPVNLETASFGDLTGNATTWERVLRKLSVRAMPPPGLPRPTEADYAGFTGWLSSSLDKAWEGRSNPGRFVVHRLNRAEYANAVRDMLDVNLDVSQLLPTDGADFGFDNIATALKTSPLLLEAYVNAAQRVAAMAVGDPEVRATTTEHIISREFSQSGYIDGLPLGTIGGTVLRHVFPADGEYNLSGRLIRGVAEGYSGVEGNDVPYTFVITIDGTEVYTASIGGPSDHELQSRDLNESREVIDKRMTGRARVTAGPHEVGFTWRERPFVKQDVWEPARRDSQEIHLVAGNPKLRTVSIEGPYKVSGVSESPSRRLLYVCHPASNTKGATKTADETACAEKILSNLARRAYRRPVNADDVAPPMAFFKQERANGNFDDGIRAGVARILSSTNFLYRIEKDPAAAAPGSAHPVSDLELASRLSFFLWSSIPDNTLLDLAAAGKLRAPGALAAQVERMLSDERADALIENFTGQWLQLRNLEAKVSPDMLMFQDFDDNTRKGFRKETEMLFGYILRQDRSTLELMNADYTFLDERLARHYGVPGIYGPRFRRVKLTDPNRFGLLGQGSVLSMTSVATRTSPVYRGKYVLSNFLNTPPPAPPPNVPSLEESNKDSASTPKTVRAQLELHRRNEPCATCHRVIDPPGFALENFDPIGRWRDKGPDGAPLDTAGKLADGSSINGPVELRQAILSRPNAFVTVVTQRLLTYALGRRIEPSDMPVVRSIVKKAAQNDYQLSSIVMSIVESAPFQMRTKLEPASSKATPAAVAEAPRRVPSVNAKPVSGTQENAKSESARSK